MIPLHDWFSLFVRRLGMTSDRPVQPSSSVANIDEWRWKLSMLQRNAEEQEIISRDRRDRRDYDQIANLAKRMGLYRFRVVISQLLAITSPRTCWKSN